MSGIEGLGIEAGSRRDALRALTRDDRKSA